MVDGYIKVEDIEEVLRGMDQVDGFVYKEDFLRLVSGLEESRVPDFVGMGNRPLLKGVTARDMIGFINLYQVSVRFDRAKGALFGLFAEDIVRNGVSLRDGDVFLVRLLLFLLW